jgi:hypothetical protein
MVLVLVIMVVTLLNWALNEDGCSHISPMCERHVDWSQCAAFVYSLVIWSIDSLTVLAFVGVVSDLLGTYRSND